MTRPEPVDESLLRDTLCGMELELIELVERQRRADIQGHVVESQGLQVEIDRIHDQLAVTADAVADAGGNLEAHGA